MIRKNIFESLVIFRLPQALWKKGMFSYRAKCIYPLISS